jgi:hypothetical protein
MLIGSWLLAALALADTASPPRRRGWRVWFANALGSPAA